VTSTDGGRPGRTATRREELLAATRRAVTRTGFAKVTVEQITREAGASLGLLHYHFDSKDEVVAEAFAQVAQEDLAELTAIARRGDGAPERLAACLAASEWTDQESWRVWIDAWGEAVHGEPMRDTLATFQRRWRTVLGAVIADGVREGAWECTDPDAAAARLLVLIDGLGLHATLHPEQVSAELASGWARRCAELELATTLPPAAPALEAAAAAPDPVELPVSLRRRDFDRGGRVDDAVYPALLAEGRAAWLASRLADVEPTPQVVLARLAVDYHRPLAPEDGPVTVACMLEGLGRSSIRLRQRIRAADGTVAVEAEVTLAARDPGAARTRPLTPAEREALRR
jgi:acyl-CoA thioesterase FadM/DNA-binding transcriptional regulator YbjK